MTTTAERQRKWKERQKKEGKKPLSVMISKKTHEVLSEEKEKTGETFPAIVERAILNLRIKTIVTCNDSGVTSNGSKEEQQTNIENVSSEIIVTSNADGYKEQILDRIVSMRDQEISFAQIARQFNEERLSTFSGKGIWHGKTVQKMYNRIKSNN